MKLTYLIIALLIVQPAMADCNLATDIKKVDGGYLYSTDCHLEVGRRFKLLDNRDAQIAELNKTIELKDLVIQKQQERVSLWMNTSLDMQNKLATYDSIQSKNNTLHLVIGAGLAFIAVWGAGQLKTK